MADNIANNLKKLNKKIDGLSIDKELALELKSDVKDLCDNAQSKALEGQLEQLNTKLESIENNNDSLKESIHDFVKSTSKTLETITKGDSENVPDKLKEYLLEIVGKIESLKSSIPNSSSSELFDENQIKNLKQELSFFQSEIETTLSKQLTDISENIETIVLDIKKQLDVFKDMLDNNTEKLVMEVLSNIKQLKADTLELSGNIKNFDDKSEKIADGTIHQIIQYSKSANEKVVNQLSEIKQISAKTEEVENSSKEAVEILKHELLVLKNNINGQIRDVLSKILVQDEIKFLCEEAISGIKNGNTEINVVRKHLKDMKLGDEKQTMLFAEMRNIIAELGNFGLSESSDKIDMIYDNMSMVNNWASSSDAVSQGFEDLCQDFEITSGKVDIIYENLSFINEWVKTLNKFSKDIEEIRNSCRGEVDLPEKIDEIYDNISAVREWSKKADALALHVKALSVQIRETENSLNTQNLNEIKRLFAQMNENISNMNTRNNKMIIESDKSNEVMRGQLKDLKTLISSFAQKSQNLGINELTQKINELKDLSVKNSEFENVVTESFTYLAEWIDAAGAALNSIKNDIANLQETSKTHIETMEQLKNAAPEISAISRILLEVQNISENLGKNSSGNGNSSPQETDYEEIKTILEYIAAHLSEQEQNTAESEKIDELSAKIETFENKMNSFETKLSSIENYMSKLIEYLEED